MADKIPSFRPARKPLPVPEARPNSAARGYDRLWRKLRRMVLASSPLCVRCPGLAHHVDHIVPLEDGGTNDHANLQPLCASCHSRKTVREDVPSRKGQS